MSEIELSTKIYLIDDPDELTDTDLEAIGIAGKIIREGGLAAFPTETVYGLGASAYDPSAAQAVFVAKGRPSDNPLIVHVADPAEAEAFAEVSDTYRDIAEKFMPGAVTVILPKKNCIPSEVTGGLHTVAVRCPSHPVARQLIRMAGVPVAAPSANLSGKPSPTSADHVVRDLTGRVDMILGGGDCVFGLESTVLTVKGERAVHILRPGGVTKEMLEEAGYTVTVDAAVTDLGAVGAKPLSPGMKYKHYAPMAEVILLDMTDSPKSFAEVVNILEEKCEGNCAVMCPAGDEEGLLDCAAVFTYSPAEENDSMAHLLFSCLRSADDKEVSRIYIPLPRTDGMGMAVYNRVIRAAGGRIVRPGDN
ncbi:MAG: threonylcarbamoyl-AMP synthase [Clostridia bacterium]|nr:threonylcarbamoyl-AMP synthase [Clostridia bacterium]